MKQLRYFLLGAILVWIASYFTYAQTDTIQFNEDTLIQQTKDTLLKKRANAVKQKDSDSLKQTKTTTAPSEEKEVIKTDESLENNTGSTITSENETALIVEVYDRNTMKQVDGVEVYLFSMPDKEYVETKISQNGTASFIIDKNMPYEIRACKMGYIKKGMLLAKIAVEPLALGQTMELDNVYYDLGKASLRAESKVELDKVYYLLKQYKTLVIEVSSHTDSRGGDDFNLNLSAKRAKSCFQYLVNKGIEPERVKHTGYGETVLLNECGNDVPCDEKQHQRNRRTEISILEIEQEPCKPEL